MTRQAGSAPPHPTPALAAAATGAAPRPRRGAGGGPGGRPAAAAATAAATAVAVLAIAAAPPSALLPPSVRQVLLGLPAYAIVVFCCVSLAHIGAGLVAFPDAPTAAASLLDDLGAARAALAERGFVMPPPPVPEGAGGRGGSGEEQTSAAVVGS
ncbi:hypothetical protein MMPV_001717 [Pyropia vietnamensis]